ncbi:MAG TPA: diaminopropionate ammonia-lyase [Clostridiaceae bacterium]|nr:diaminopropionate ammonia-lyase [Clostridiaceae bacterium]HBG38124.1 diaminopropionate ammonia-lyase [Clostridiaceae bacterium]HBN28290.1 diaminopropionate ammonia-lyase [Clostridiaceae bacterium]HBX48169.1 diaminopropionate ammonia-lyase [Clostridiaceae bacterium]HCL49719.1 diaminopropionate ammonia-lyase [Clostridiaceae bacterium]
MDKEKLIKLILNSNSRNNNIQKVSTQNFKLSEIQKARNFHKSFPQYSITPLIELNELSKMLGVSKIWVKDESYRFGLNAFKVLGGSYAIGKYLSNKLNMDISEVPYEKMISKDIKEKLGEITFVTATDGNHGRGVAWVAHQLGQKSVVYMPKGSAKMRFDNIKKEGANVTITDLNYDDAVRLANDNAKKYGWVMIQDTAWEGYEEIPLWIMQGYTTIIDEVIEQLKERGEELPTHIFLQAGVGSFAGAIQGYVAAQYGKERPITVIVEPHNAACIFKSASMNDGKPYAVKGDLKTIMAGLACGEPNTIGWNILRDYADAYVSCEDEIAARGMRVLSNPLKNDKRVISGESGAAGFGLLSLILEKEEYRDILKKLNINKESRILTISTEGATDLDGFKNIVWNGFYPLLNK